VLAVRGLPLAGPAALLRHSNLRRRTKLDGKTNEQVQDCGDSRREDGHAEEDVGAVF
jgi:hypothetical protein